MDLTDEELSAPHDLVANKAFYGDNDIAYSDDLGAMQLRAILEKLCEGGCGGPSEAGKE